MKKKTVLFICSLNSVRSQMAEGLLNARCKNRYTAFSGGIAPAGPNPCTVAVMKEVGIDVFHVGQRNSRTTLAHGLITS